MKIGIMGAMQEEIELIKSDITDAEIFNIGSRNYITGKLYSKDVIVSFSRWGKVASASTVMTLINLFKVDIIVFTGVAGAASNNLNIGDIVIADKLIQHDMDASAFPWLKKYEIPLLGVSYFNVDEKLLSLAEASASNYLSNEMLDEINIELLNSLCINKPNVVKGTIASGDQFIADGKKITQLVCSIDNLLCVEMEGAAVAQVCFENNVPFVVFRSISDKADHSAEIDFTTYVSSVAKYFSRGMIKNFLYNL